MTEHELIEQLKEKFPNHDFSLGLEEITEHGLRKTLLVDNEESLVKIRWLKGVATNLEIHRDTLMEEVKITFQDSIFKEVSSIFLAPTRRIIENS